MFFSKQKVDPVRNQTFDADHTGLVDMRGGI